MRLAASDCDNGEQTSRPGTPRAAAARRARDLTRRAARPQRRPREARLCRCPLQHVRAAKALRA
eukprot:5095521-Alexandrium_andersonii.AAC.1